MMLDRCQYTILNDIRKRTDANFIHGQNLFLSGYNRDDIWKFLDENSFIREKGGEGAFSTITFQGRVALAAYEAKNVDARSI